MKIYLAGNGHLGFIKDEFTDFNRLESFHYIAKRELPFIGKYNSFLLDSGAFTFMNQNKGNVNWNAYIEEYAAFINEHHFVPFFGQYYFAYIPHKKGKILGLSKVARVVDYFSARLQIQERLCSDIVNYLFWELAGDERKHPPFAMGIVMKGEHLCKSMRGAKKKGVMTTQYFLGEFCSNDKLKQQFLDSIK